MDLRMGAHFNITSASLSAFDTIAIIILVPIYDRLLIPLLRRYNLAPTYLQRIGNRTGGKSDHAVRARDPTVMLLQGFCYEGCVVCAHSC